MKIKLFTHSDLDGIGCAIVAKFGFTEQKVDVTYCEYHNVNEKITEFLSSDELSNYYMIMITDISVNEEVALLLDEMNQRMGVQLLDHHETAEWLNKYEWANVMSVDEKGVNTCGTSMLANTYDIGSFDAAKLNEFVELVRRYDTWDWANIHNDKSAKMLNDLFWFYGRDRFVQKYMISLTDSNLFFDSQDLTILQVEEERIERYIKKMEKQLTIRHVGRYNVGVVFGDQYMSEVCHALHDKNPELDLVAMVNMSSGKVSYRTNRDDVNVGEFAKYFGGGGRQATAGSEINDTNRNDILDKLFT